MAKEEKKTIIIDDKEHIYDELSDTAKVIVNHIADLERKINGSEFNLQQLQFGKDAFVKALKEEVDKVDDGESDND